MSEKENLKLSLVKNNDVNKEINDTTSAINKTLINPLWLLTEIYNSSTLSILFWWKKDFSWLVESVWRLRTAANDEKYIKNSND